MMYKTVLHLFEEFARERTSNETKVVGIGLGMPIVKALVDLMGGTIRVESEVGKIIVAHKKDLIIQLKDGQINLDIVQKSGKNKMDSQSFNNGTAFLGSVLK